MMSKTLWRDVYRKAFTIVELVIVILIRQPVSLVNYCHHSLLDNCKDMDKNNWW